MASNPVIITWGRRSREDHVASPREREITRCAFNTLAAFLRESDAAEESPSPFLTVEVVSTGQIWVYTIDRFLDNLALVPKTREAAIRLRGELTT